MSVTKNIAKYADDNCINLAELSKKSGVPYSVVHNSLGKNATRELRADELTDICDVLHINPMDFRDQINSNAE